MSFRIDSSSPVIKRELESKLAEFQGQLDEGFEYEIAAQSLPREQALESAEGVAEQLGANSIFLSVGLFPGHTKLVEEEDPDIAIGLPTASDDKRTAEAPSTALRAGSSATQNENRTAEGGCATQNSSSATPLQAVHSPRIDAQKIKVAAAAKASLAGAIFKKTGEHTGAALKAAGERTANFTRDAGVWAGQKANGAKAVSGELRSRLAEKSAQWKNSFGQWSARRQERRRIESEARKARQRAAHREAELAAISAQIMLERQKSDEKARTATEPRFKPQAKPVIQPAARNIETEERDFWPVWRSAFVAAACLALIGVFLLAGGGKQSSASPETSTELSRPAKIVPARTVEQPKPQPVMAKQAAEIPAKAAAKPAVRKRLALVRDGGDAFEEVTVRNYTIAPPKKNAKGVVQITDEE
jgi:hypothetical protein